MPILELGWLGLNRRNAHCRGGTLLSLEVFEAIVDGALLQKAPHQQMNWQMVVVHRRRLDGVHDDGEASRVEANLCNDAGFSHNLDFWQAIVWDQVQNNDGVLNNSLPIPVLGNELAFPSE
jgi:hypothetical protein